MNEDSTQPVWGDPTDTSASCPREGLSRTLQQGGHMQHVTISSTVKLGLSVYLPQTRTQCLPPPS